MKIETKFNIGDVVYVCKNNSTYEKEQCKICEGSGFITLKEKSFRCPECYGDKFTYTQKVKKFVPKRRIIRRVIALVSENKIKIRYETKSNCRESITITEHKDIMFATQEEAECRCKELNEVE